MAKPSKETLMALRLSYDYRYAREEKTKETIAWVEERNAAIFASLSHTTIDDCDPWFYDETKSTIHNANGSFFSIQGLKYSSKNIKREQPIIVQDEVGYLGFICRNNNGLLEFLIQAKIEPGNVNKVQLSPTIQATRSNFTQKHGGRKPLYLDYFVDADKYEVLCDYDEPEQCSRFLGKYNRNVAIVVNEEVEVSENFRWLSLAEIKSIMNLKHNLVNMDTRTVLSCLPYRDCFSVGEEHGNCAKSFLADDHSEEILAKLGQKRKENEFQRSLCRLDEISEWEIKRDRISKESAPFSVGYFDITIEGREKTEWKQPLFVAEGPATFGTALRKNPENGIYEILVRIKEEVGAKDGLVLAPPIQKEWNEIEPEKDGLYDYFRECFRTEKHIVADVMLSEEGGRFYHEQNSNEIVILDRGIELPDDCFWVNFATLSSLIRREDPPVNIQLRNLFSLIRSERMHE